MAGITWGVLDCFFGYRVFKITLALFGALLGLWLAQAAALRFGLGEMAEIGLMIAGHLLHLRRLRNKERIVQQMEKLNLGMRNEIAERQKVERDLVSAKEMAEHLRKERIGF